MYIDYIEHHIVDHCNLKCAGCSHFSPLVDEPWLEDINDFKKDFTQLAQMTEIGTIRLMGGEPLLHPQLPDFISIIRELFPKSSIWIVTNGILLKERKEELLKLCNDLNVGICVSNYNLKFDLRDYLSGFKITRVDSKGLMYNISLDLSGAQNPMSAFQKCDLHRYHYYFFQGGRFFPCCISSNLHYFNEYFEGVVDAYDLDEISILIYEHSIEEIIQFLNEPIDMCKYCNTERRMRTHSPFRVSKKEIEEWTYH